MLKFFLLFFILLSFTARSQEIPGHLKSQKDTTYTMVDHMPEYPGGETNLMEYLRTNVMYPEDARLNKTEGKVYVSFVIDKTGKIRDVQVIKPVYPSIDAETIRVISAMPDWRPGMLNGQPVNVKYNIPLNFTLSH